MDFDVIVVAGQSNAEGNGLGDEQNRILPSEKVMQVVDCHPTWIKPDGKGNAPIETTLPTQCRLEIADEWRDAEGKYRADLATAFARKYMEEGLLQKGRKILLVRAAVGGTGFTKKQWGVHNVLYRRLCHMTDFALRNPSDRLVAFLWHQGEHDAFEGQEKAVEQQQREYYDALTEMLQDFRQRYGADVPIVTGGFVPDWQRTFDRAQALENTLREACLALGNAAFVPADGLKSNNVVCHSSDIIHFCRQSVYEFGERYFTAYKRLLTAPFAARDEASGAARKRFILDTDIGADSDDVGALSVLCNLKRQGKIDIAAVTVCNAQDDSAMAADIIADCYGVSCPIGKATSYGTAAIYGGYTRAIASAYPSRLVRGQVPFAKDVLKEALSKEDAITLITIGPLTNIAELLSDEEGKRLFAEKVAEMYVMAGKFDGASAEWNITEDIPAAQFVLQNVHCPITFLPHEAGVDIFTGGNFLNGQRSPMQLGYYVHNITPRNSWDPLTVYCAAVECLPTSANGTVTIDEEGVTRFIEGEGNHRYVTNDFDKVDMQRKLDELMTL